jgi:uroporphyrinogen decarboxylase
MSISHMTSLQRVLTTLSHKEPDRVPLFFLFTVTGAKEQKLSIKNYFSKAQNVVDGQLNLLEKYKHDCLYGFYYASIEFEAWGGDTLWFEDGPPNAGAPIIRNHTDIDKLFVPKVKSSPGLQKVLETQSRLKDKVGDDVPIIGVTISPFSLPVMQMGFSGYLDLIYGDRDRFNQLMKLNEEFCIEWSNAQLAAGATAICYFDPVSSTTVIPAELYLETGHTIAKRTIAAINGPTATHLASGRCIPILDHIATTGTAIVGVSAMEDLDDIKENCHGKLTLMGNLNAVEMCRWSPQEAEHNVKEAIRQAGPDGGFLLSDNHGEIPWQVPDDVLAAISDAVHTWGHYPLDWIADDKS